MAPQTGTAILVLVVFVLPGFVALRYAEQTYRTRAGDSTLERILTALYFSLLSYVVIAAGAVLLLDADRLDVRQLWRGAMSIETYLVLAVAGVAVPLAIAELARQWSRTRVRLWLLSRLGVSTVHKTPSGWEHFFLSNRWAYVRATLKDGRVIGGFFGAESFAGYTADTPDLYLEQRYQLDEKDWFDGPASGTMGVYIRAEEIVSVEFYEAGAPPPRPRWWRRVRARITAHDAASEDTPLELTDRADPQERRDHAVGPDDADPPAASTAPDRLGELGETTEQTERTERTERE